MQGSVERKIAILVLENDVACSIGLNLFQSTVREWVIFKLQ